MNIFPRMEAYSGSNQVISQLITPSLLITVCEPRGLLTFKSSK